MDSSSSEPDNSPFNSSGIEEAPRSVPKRNANFWFYDGSIVLAVDAALFRVHQTILATHSEVFSDLFSIPQPPGHDLIEGCPVVRLHGDTVEDFVDLLNAVYDPSHFEKLPPQADLETVLDFTSGILRLSTKYLLRSLRQRCITLLTAKFPTTFNEYIAKSTPAVSSSQVSSSYPLHKTERYTSDSIMRAVHLAQSCNLPTLIPYLFYCVARLNPRRLLKSRTYDVSWKDKTIALVGRERLRLAEMSLSHSFLLVFQRSQNCRSLLCGEARGPHKEWHVLEAAGKAPNPLREYRRWDMMNVCMECIAHSKKLHEDGRREVWDRLPEIFGMDKWENLKLEQDR